MANELDLLTKKAGKKHVQILKKFLVYKNQTITDSRLICGVRGKAAIPPDNIVEYPHYMHGLNRGAYKPKDDPYTLSVRSNPRSEWGLETKFDENGNWIYTDYNFREKYKSYLNEIEGLKKCYRDRIPIGVIYSPKPASNKILGLGIIDKIKEYSFHVVPLTKYSETENDKLSDKFVEKQFETGDYSSLGGERSYLGRKKQSQFKKILLKMYGGKCLFCGFYRQPYLIGSHIVPVKIMRKEDDKNSMHPENGLLLCRLCDTAFENGDITLDEKYNIAIFEKLQAHVKIDKIAHRWIESVHNELLKDEISKLKPGKKFIKRKLELLKKARRQN